MFRSFHRINLLLRDKLSTPSLNVTLTVMATGKNMQTWKGRMETFLKLKRQVKKNLGHYEGNYGPWAEVVFPFWNLH